MKKIVLLIILASSLTLHFGGSGVSVITFQEAQAQSQTGCWNPNSGQGSGFFNWLGNAISNVGNAIANVANAIGSFFSGGDDEGGEEFGEENGDDDWLEPSGPADDFVNPMDDPWFQPPGFGEDEWDIMNNLNYYYALYINGGNPPMQDCNGVWGGSAYVGSCGICIAGSTGIPACYLDSPRVDTVKPTKIPCDSAANARGTKLTRVRDSINNNPDVLKLKDSAFNSPNEAGLSIINNNGSYGTFNFQSGASNHVEVLQSYPGQNIVAGIHAHNKSGLFTAASTPSPPDLYHLIEGQLENPNYIADYIFVHDSTEWAIMIDDTTKAANFVSVVPIDSATVAPPNSNDWSKTYRLTDGTSLYDKWMFWVLYLYQDQHYPKESIEAYANVVFTAQNLDSGIKFYKRENGEFKELSYQIITDSTGNVSVKITICQ